MVRSISIHALETFPLVKCGDSLADIIVQAAEREGLPIKSGDVVVISQKIVSKAERRVVKLSEVKVSSRARELASITKKDPRLVELILHTSRRIVKATRQVLIAETKQGQVCLSAGIDKSNVEGPDSYALLPENPDKSATRLKRRIEQLIGGRIAVVISDTYSRPFRRGQVDFAIGFSGIAPITDYRGKPDLFGYRLRFKYVAVVDELASAAELVKGQGAERAPVVIIKGLRGIRLREGYTSRGLKISRREDVFKGAL